MLVKASKGGEMYRVLVSKIILCCILIIINGCAIASSSDLIESNHSYSDDFDYTWVEEDLGASQIRLHFEYLKFAKDDGLLPLDFDKLILMDKYGTVLKTYGSYFGLQEQDFWTDWYTGDTLQVKILTDSSGTDYGFKIDKAENRTGIDTPNDPLPESHHDYASNFKSTWPDISEPGAARIRIHFEKLDLSDTDKIVIYDKYGEEFATYSSFFGLGKKDKDFWTEWCPGDTLKVELETNYEGTGYGFKIDDVDARPGPNNTYEQVNLKTSDNIEVENRVSSDLTSSESNDPIFQEQPFQEQPDYEIKSLFEYIVSIVTQNPLISSIFAMIIGTVLLKAFGLNDD